MASINGAKFFSLLQKKMKILFLADLNSPHTIKWINGLAQKNITILGFGLNKFDPQLYQISPSIQLESLNLDLTFVKSNQHYFRKIRYLLAVPKIWYHCFKFNPDLIHAHYATSYGLLASLCFFYQKIISVWGSDVYLFPNSLLKKLILKFVLFRADKILATGMDLAQETQKYSYKKIEITPFGIDPEVFKPSFRDKSSIQNQYNIGIVKSLDSKYGIEHLLHVFATIKKKHPQLYLKLFIIGGGSLKPVLMELTHNYQLIPQQDIIFTDTVSPLQVVSYHQLLDIEVYPSQTESFGVSVLEASACEIPVIGYRVGGLPEVIVDGVTGYLVEKNNLLELEQKMTTLIFDFTQRKQMGINGRKFVLENFTEEICLNKMLQIYASMSSLYNSRI